ncbi:MAG: SprT family zinc-dependent metalloprotease, partial [Vallitaleaceae bacterium]|nr:SprT family zinc-dependent metalloprotease [Vallitaleaceae bacterium]
CRCTKLKTYTNTTSDLEYKIVYKKRKTIGIYMDTYGNFEMRVPVETSRERIQQFLEEKWSWIMQNQKDAKEKLQGAKVRVYEDGESYLYMGHNYPIVITVEPTLSQDTIRLDEVDKVIIIFVKDNEGQAIKALLKRFYYQTAKAIIEERIRYYSKDFKVKPRKMTISNNQKTWGTCNGMRELTFNWRLAMAPMAVIEYIVIHEMCHMVHLNHDRSFWRLVGKHVPDYEEQQSWLSQSLWQMTV